MSKYTCFRFKNQSIIWYDGTEAPNFLFGMLFDTTITQIILLFFKEKNIKMWQTIDSINKVCYKYNIRLILHFGPVHGDC